jgi:hypothetical protein
MKARFTALCLLAVVAGIVTTAFAQEQSTQRPMFMHPRPQLDEVTTPATPLQTWHGTFTVGSAHNHFTMVGTDPSSTNVPTTVPVFIIPMKMVFTKGTTKTTFDPTKPIGSGLSAVQQTLASPIFQSSIDYVQGGTDIGKTQYEDAFQRGNFWTDVMTNTDYHILLGTPTVLPELTINVPAAQGTTGTSQFGPPGTLGIASFNWFLNNAPTWVKKYSQVTPTAIPIFVTYNVYLSQTNNFGGCCVGGFHDMFGSPASPQTYAQFSFMGQSTKRQVFSSDVSALSHELGEWIDDPYVNNTQGACGGILEDGDPLENNPDFGDHIYKVGGYSYHIQDLVFLKYFGQTPSTSVNDWWTFQGFTFSQVCQNGQ